MGIAGRAKNTSVSPSPSVDGVKDTLRYYYYYYYYYGTYYVEGGASLRVPTTMRY